MTVDYEAFFRETQAMMAEWQREDWIQRLIEQSKQEGKLEGKLEGKQEGEWCSIVKMVLRASEMGKKISELADLLGIDEAVVRQILTCHEEHPDMSVEQIAQLWIRMKN